MKVFLKPFFLILSCFILLLSGCNKGPIQFNFSGKVSESVSGVGLAGATVQISQKIVQSGITSVGHTFAGETSTDSNGEFAIGFDREKTTEFLITIEQDNYFDHEEIISSSEITTEGTNTIDRTLDAKSWITFNITNSAPLPSDEFRLITQTFREDCNGCAENKSTTFTGSVDTSFTFVTTGGEYVKFIEVYVSGGFSKMDSIFATPFETIVRNINY